jgi:arylsulfatase A-like enzyme
MVEHDGHVGQLLKKLDDLGIADNTIVVYTSDNGAEVMTWPIAKRVARWTKSRKVWTPLLQGIFATSFGNG